MRRPVPELQGDRVLLRPLREGDIAERLEAGRWSDQYSQAIAGDLVPSAEFTQERAAGWFASRPESMKWAIEIDSRLSGEIRLDRIEEQDASASLAIGIFIPALWGKGYGTEAIKMVLDYAFNEMEMHRIWLMVMESNVRAVRAYEKCGFKVEGRLRDSVRTSSGWESDVIMSILEDEYEQLRENQS